MKNKLSKLSKSLKQTSIDLKPLVKTPSSIILDMLMRNADKFYEDVSHRLHLHYGVNEYIITIDQAFSSTYLRGIATAIMFTNSSIQFDLANMIDEVTRGNKLQEEKNKREGELKSHSLKLSNSSNLTDTNN